MPEFFGLMDLHSAVVICELLQQQISLALVAACSGSEAS